LLRLSIELIKNVAQVAWSFLKEKARFMVKVEVSAYLRCVFKDEVRALASQSSTATGWIHFFHHFAPVLLVWFFFPLEFSMEGAVWALLGAFVVGLKFRAISNMMHECVHGAFVSSAAANRGFGRLFGAITLVSFLEYKREHLSHHRFTGVPGSDRDLSKYSLTILSLDSKTQAPFRAEDSRGIAFLGPGDVSRSLGESLFNLPNIKAPKAT
jgi:Fatty acid desaturase